MRNKSAGPTPGRKRRPRAKPNPIVETEEESSVPVTFLRPSGRTLTWDNFLKNVDNLTRIPPVPVFKQAPLSKIWEYIAKPGIVVELRNPFVQGDVDAFWVATIVYFAGYFALAKYERFDLEPAHLVWLTFISDVINPVGWCEANGKLLYPGAEVAREYPNYMELMKDLVADKETISGNHLARLQKEIDSMTTYNPAVPVEVVNISDVSENRIARITASFGDQYNIQYTDLPSNDGTGNLVCGNPMVNSMHPLGFSDAVGLPIVGGIPGLVYPWLKDHVYPEYPSELKIRSGMCFETRHPDFPYKIVGARVIRVLRKGYFIAETCDFKEEDRTAFYTHVTSALLFPSGWGRKWEICVEDYKSQEDTREFLPLDLLPQRMPHDFQLGMVVEARDTSEKAFFGAATVKKIADHMLYLHFLNWDETMAKNSVWMDAECGELYPIGYTELFGLEFQGHV